MRLARIGQNQFSWSYLDVSIAHICWHSSQTEICKIKCLGEREGEYLKCLTRRILSQTPVSYSHDEIWSHMADSALFRSFKA